eukprot:3515017-Lingulodinium_polyedra.AAC.1
MNRPLMLARAQSMPCTLVCSIASCAKTHSARDHATVAQGSDFQSDIGGKDRVQDRFLTCSFA